MSKRSSIFLFVVAGLCTLLSCTSPTSSDSEPEKITDLRLILGRPTSAYLNWTAPNSNGVSLYEYDLRYSTTPMRTSEDWGNATRITGLTAPSEAGIVEEFTLTDLKPSHDYYAAIRAVGKNGKISDHSNQIHIVTSDTGTAFSFSAPDLYGVTHSSSEWMNNDLVIINFWGVWCVYCIRETPDLIRIHNEFADKGVTIVGFNIGDGPGIAREYVEQNQIPWLNVEIPKEVVVEYGVRGYPTTIFLDRNGNEFGRLAGQQSYERFSSAINYLFNEVINSPN